MSITVVGVGAMGGALVRAALTSAHFSAEDLILVEQRPDRVVELKTSLPAPVFASFDGPPAQAKLCVVAVKPQDAASVLPEIGRLLKPEAIVISIMAGLTVGRIHELLGSGHTVVRAMPNLPLSVGKGVVPYFVGAPIAAEDRQYMERFLGAGGATFPVAAETLVDAATAISGSGPGFTFFFMEQFATVAAEFGFSPDQTKALVLSVFGGAAELWARSSISPADLRAQVTSKAGTTAAGLEAFTTGGGGSLIQTMIRRANERCCELNTLVAQK